MKFRVEMTYSTRKYFVEYKHWLWGWEAYDRLRFNTYREACDHIDRVKQFRS